MQEGFTELFQKIVKIISLPNTAVELNISSTALQR